MPRTNLVPVVVDHRRVADVGLAIDPSLMGGSAALKEIVADLFDRSRDHVILDIGCGRGELGRHLAAARRFIVDGIDGHAPTVAWSGMEQFYRNIWLGMVEDLDEEMLAEYDGIAFIDVIEHLQPENVKPVLHKLLGGMREDAVFIVSTPLWFYRQGHVVEGDLEEHHLAIPIGEFSKLKPRRYNMQQYVGMFELGKEAIPLIDQLQVVTDPTWDQEAADLIADCERRGVVNGGAYWKKFPRE